MKDPTVVKLNPGKEKIMRVVKSTQIIPPYNSPVSTSYPQQGFQIAMYSALGSYIYGNTMIFDPSGSWGNATGTISSAASVTVPHTIQDWPLYQQLYTHYKVNRIVLNFSCCDTGDSGLQSQPPTIYIRYNDEYVLPLAGSVTAQNIAMRKNFIKKTFTAERMNFKYSFRPKVMQLYDNTPATGAVLATETRKPVKMPWTPINTPSQLFGIQLYTLYQTPSSGICYINCDITYHLSFKQQN